MARPLMARFWDKTWKRASSDCWPWIGYVDAQGYGRLWVDKTLGSVPAHRVSFIVHHLHGEVELPDTFQILSCPYLKSCVNPDHLKLAEGNDIGDRILWKKNLQRRET